MGRVTVGLLASVALAAVVLTGWLAVYGIVYGDVIIGPVVNRVWVALMGWVMLGLLLAGVNEAARFGWSQHRLARAARRGIPVTDLRAVKR